MCPQASRNITIFGQGLLTESFVFPVENEGFTEFLDFERPLYRLRCSFPVIHDFGKKLQVADMGAQICDPTFISFGNGDAVSRRLLFSFPAFNLQPEFVCCVLGLETVFSPGRMTIEPGRSHYANITAITHGCFGRIAYFPHFFHAFSKILRFSPFMQFSDKLLRLPSNPLFKRLSQQPQDLHTAGLNRKMTAV